MVISGSCEWSAWRKRKGIIAWFMTDDLDIVNKSGNRAFIALGYLMIYYVFTGSMQNALKLWTLLALVVSRSRQARTVYH